MEELSNLMKAVAHPQRLQIAALLDEHSELNGIQLQEFTNIQQAVVSQHVIKMQNLGFLLSKRRGSKVYYSLSMKGRQIIACISDQIANALFI